MEHGIKSGDTHELSTDINVITAEINAYQRVAGEAIFEIGRRLKYVKEYDLVHGEWERWVSEDAKMSPSQARKFVTIADEFGPNRSTWNDIGVQALYLIATMPEESRTESHTIPSTGAEKTVNEMTVRELREVKAELKRTQEDREQALADREDAEVRAKQAEAQAETAFRSEEILRSQLDELEDGKPEVEIRTKYVEIPDAEAVQKEPTRSAPALPVCNRCTSILYYRRLPVRSIRQS